MAAVKAAVQVIQLEKEQDSMLLPDPTTKNLSTLFTKKFIGALISHIVYARNLFNECDFTDKMFDGQKIKVIQDSSSGSQGAKCLYRWLEGAFHALDRQYLKSLTIEIIDKSGHICEAYTFSLVYKKSDTDIIECCIHDEKECVLASGNTREAVRNMIRNVLVMTSTLPVLPSECTTSMKLAYFEDVTPLDYEPPNFKAYHGRLPLELNLSKLSCGSVETSFHKLTVTTKYQRIKEKKDLCSKVNCLCELDDEKKGHMMECTGCHTLQHYACYKFLSETEASQNKYHTCFQCSSTNITDEFSSTECIFRRVLEECVSVKALSIRKLMLSIRIDAEAAINNLKRLQREGFINKPSQPFSLQKQDLMHHVVKANLNSLKSKYFIQSSQPL